jgi:hypothetical protein
MVCRISLNPFYFSMIVSVSGCICRATYAGSSCPSAHARVYYAHIIFRMHLASSKWSPKRRVAYIHVGEPSVLKPLPDTYYGGHVYLSHKIIHGIHMGTVRQKLRRYTTRHCNVRTNTKVASFSGGSHVCKTLQRSTGPKSRTSSTQLSVRSAQTIPQKRTLLCIAIDAHRSHILVIDAH